MVRSVRSAGFEKVSMGVFFGGGSGGNGLMPSLTKVQKFKDKEELRFQRDATRFAYMFCSTSGSITPKMVPKVMAISKDVEPLNSELHAGD